MQNRNEQIWTEIRTNCGQSRGYQIAQKAAIQAIKNISLFHMDFSTISVYGISLECCSHKQMIQH